MANYLVSLRGQLGSGSSADEFTHTHGIVSASEPNIIANSVAVRWRAAFETGANPLRTIFEPTTRYTEVVVAEILNLAGTPAPAIAVGYHVPFTPAMPGTAITGAVPMQNAIAVSYWACCYDNGAQVKGRFYLPSPSQIVVDTVTGLLTTDGQTWISDAVEGYFTGLQADGHTPAVWSRGGKKGAPAMRTATRLRVGDKIDTIRRRRNAVIEAYSEVTL